MEVSIRKIQNVIDTLQTILDRANECDAVTVNTECNTYGLYNFISFGSDGYLNLDADIDDLIDAPEFDDDMP